MYGTTAELLESQEDKHLVIKFEVKKGLTES